MSNEHPDMHGNPMDAPFLCHHCGRDFLEEKAFGSARNDELLFCSGDCVEAWEESQRPESDSLPTGRPFGQIGCLFPGNCVMPGEHFTSECCSIDEAEEYYENFDG